MIDSILGFRKLIRKLHLIIGLISGILIFVIAITGCTYTFKNEIETLTQKWRQVEVKDQAFLLPSEAEVIGQKIFPGKKPHSVNYGLENEAGELIYFQEEPLFYSGLVFNPYSGEVIKVKDYNNDFFRWVLLGHYYLWLPPKIGQPIVACTVLVFVFMLLSGIILWWPKKRALRQSFSIKFRSGKKRFYYDLHSVLGFYASWVAVILCLTGLVWGFEWLRDGIYHSTGGQKSLTWQPPVSDTSIVLVNQNSSIEDNVWHKMKNEYPQAALIEIHYPEVTSSSIYVSIKPKKQTYWRSEYRFFDRYSMNELEPTHVWGKFKNATVADKLMRLNYDIHVGAIGGLPGKILVFFTGLICASLPITGFIIWWNRRKQTTTSLLNDLE